MTLVEEHNNLIITNTNEDATVCKGDSGGPLFQSDVHDIHTLVGILSGSNGCNDENKAKPPFETASANVRKHLKWICKVTGVCDPSFDNRTYDVIEDRDLSKLKML
ncbi:unnamed protein product [Nippostrongylus brasiliensis]|uniref:Peptidase S1 domain-containing protein n=1 Tax=Nippostrongylus brasiliensis TaxID=27835 RepID=A0A0N4XQU8_NIPBR|nr:unnamed protein product [Nippostrongylus brasiliensis]